MNTDQFLPPIFIAHGGGPLPLLNDQNHQYLISELKQIPQLLKNQPKAILVVSAHWEENQVTLLETLKPDLLFDYYGFPPETYKYHYNVKPDVNVNLRIRKLFKDLGIDIKSDNQRGYDHGVFVPLMIMYPNANIPVSQISICKSLDPEYHLKIGEILSPLSNEGILILCSGMSFHNMQGFFNQNAKLIKHNLDFHKFLIDSLTEKESNYEKRKNHFIDWKNQSNGSGIMCHPREEHFIPLLVCIGAAKENRAHIKQFNIMNYNVINVIFDK